MGGFNHHISGEEVGRLILRDLAAIYKNSRAGKPAAGIITPEEKAVLVNSLVEPPDVARYNEFRYVHEYLSRAAVMFLLEETTAESCFYQLVGLLECLKLAETENAYFLLGQPRIITPRQRTDGRRLFDSDDSGDPDDYGRGRAVLEAANPPEESGRPDRSEGWPASGCGRIDAGGRYQPPDPVWRRPFMAENVLAAKKDDLLGLLADFRAALKEALVIKTAVGLMGKFVGVPEVAEVVGPVSLHRVEELNRVMAGLPDLIVRRGVFPGERPAGELAAELAAILVPIEAESLKPGPAARRQARRAVDFSIAQGHSEKLYAILRGGG